jgi:hypothetical protein
VEENMHNDGTLIKRTLVEVKVVTSTLGSFGASVAIAILNATAGDSELLGHLPPWLQFVIITFVPSIVTFLGGYVKGSTTSRTSDSYVPPASRAA